MLTKPDIIKLKEIFVTKDEFRELRSEVGELKSMIHEVIFELKDMREEFSAITKDVEAIFPELTIASDIGH